MGEEGRGKIALTADQAFAEIEARRISLTEAFDGRIWLASIERVRGKKRFTKPDMEVVSAAASSPIGAVTALIERLDAEIGQQELWRESAA